MQTTETFFDQQKRLEQDLLLRKQRLIIIFTLGTIGVMTLPFYIFLIYVILTQR
jgi:hypothetical protein